MVKRRRRQQTRRTRARRRCSRPQGRGWLGLLAGWALRNAQVEFPTRKCAQQLCVCPTLASPSICVNSVCFTPSPALPLVQACVCRACCLCYTAIPPRSLSLPTLVRALPLIILAIPRLRIRSLHVLSRQQPIRNYRRSLPTFHHCHAPTPTNTIQASLLDESLLNIACLLAGVSSNIIIRCCCCCPAAPLLSPRLARRPQHAPWQIQPPTPSRESPATGRSDRKPSVP
jgi:hypothetical protein